MDGAGRLKSRLGVAFVMTDHADGAAADRGAFGIDGLILGAGFEIDGVAMLDALVDAVCVVLLR